MAKTILTKRQRQLLILLSKQAIITKKFYLSGGTALAEYYLRHRYSEDLDFFSLDEVDPMAIQVILKKQWSVRNKLNFRQKNLDIKKEKHLRSLISEIFIESREIMISH